MRLDNLLRLTEGVLLTSPSVSAADGFALEPSSVQRGFAYFAKDRLVSSIEEAVKKGAYAIFTDKEVPISDPEIAWIRVESIEMALIRLMRFEVASCHHRLVHLSPLEYALMRALSLPKSLCFLTDSLAHSFYTLMQASAPLCFFSTNRALLGKIAPQFTTLPPALHAPQVLERSTLFQSTFTHKERYYGHLPLSSIFISSFAQVVEFLDTLEVEYTPWHLKSIPHFEPLFVDKRLRIHPFGTTRQALIIESDPALFEQEIAYIQTHFPTLSLFTCKPSGEALHVKTTQTYANVEALLSLDPHTFRYGLILGDKEEIETTLSHQPNATQLTLF
ncbi:MAG: hypothetical protein IBX45_09155 [Campylobacterales bacterium]|nr:hypothetical protein [Campylobacterales bacterium]